MIDCERTVLILMIQNMESFETTNLRKEYFLNKHYSNMFECLNDYYKRHQNINYIEISKEHPEFNSKLYLEMLNTTMAIDDWEKILESLENDIVNNYKIWWAKKLLDTNMGFNEFKDKIEELAKIDVNKLKYYKTSNEIDMSSNENVFYIKTGIRDIDKYINKLIQKKGININSFIILKIC